MHSDLKGIRDRASAKAKRLASGESTGKVDASSFTAYSDPTTTDEQTGPKVTSRRKFKNGGKVEGDKAKKHVGSKPRSAKHDDVAEDKKLIKSMVKPGAIKKADGGKAHGKDCSCKMCSGVRVKRADGGRLLNGAKAAGMAGAMGGGLLPMGMASIIGARKNRGGSAGHDKDCDCKKCSGGRVERKTGGRVGKTNINIIIGQKPDAAPVALPMVPPAPPPMMGKPPMPPAGGVPPQLMAALAAGRGPGGMPAPGGAPPRPFKRGGKVYSSAKDMDAGSGSGVGRIEKTEIAGKSHR